MPLLHSLPPRRLQFRLRVPGAVAILDPAWSVARYNTRRTPTLNKTLAAPLSKTVFLMLTLDGGSVLGSVVVGRRTCDLEVAVNALPGSLGQLSLPSLWGR